MLVLRPGTANGKPLRILVLVWGFLPLR